MLSDTSCTAEGATDGQETRPAFESEGRSIGNRFEQPAAAQGNRSKTLRVRSQLLFLSPKGFRQPEVYKAKRAQHSVLRNGNANGKTGQCCANSPSVLPSTPQITYTVGLTFTAVLRRFPSDQVHRACGWRMHHGASGAATPPLGTLGSCGSRRTASYSVRNVACLQHPIKSELYGETTRQKMRTRTSQFSENS